MIRNVCYDQLGVNIFTAGQVAYVCGVQLRTANKWIDAGLLEGSFRLPGSAHRRVPYPGLEKFLRDQGMPLDRLTDYVAKSKQERAEMKVDRSARRKAASVKHKLKVARTAAEPTATTPEVA